MYRIFFLIVACLMGSAVQAQDASDIVEALSKRYDAMESMRTTFVQTATSEFLDAPEQFSGTLSFSDVGYRIETGNQTIVTDGVTTWIHNRGQNQLIVNDFIEDEYAFSLTSFLQQLDADYTASYSEARQIGGNRHDVIELAPNDEWGAFRTVRIAVRQSDGLVTWLRVLDLNDVEMIFDLSNIEVNPQLSADEFTYSVSGDVDIVDLRN